MSVLPNVGISKDGSGNLVFSTGGISAGTVDTSQSFHFLNPEYNDTVATVLNGTTAGTISYIEPFAGINFKLFNAIASGYENNSAGNQTITFPVAFVNTPVIMVNSTGLTLSVSTTVLTITAPNNTTTFTGVITVIGA